MNAGEKVLVNQFKFGFELEGFVKETKEDRDHPDLDSYDAAYARVEKYIASYFEKYNSLDSDGSLEPSARGGYEFEWPSPVLDFTPANINKCINFLQGLKKQGIYTNSTCGFHVHLSYPDMSFEDIRWIVLQVAMDDKVQAMIGKFHGRNFFTEEYANRDYLLRIRRTVESNMERDKKIQSLLSYLSTDKYRTLRIHPQRTLEWRGPRGFLERRKAGIVKDFFKLLWQFNRWISRAVTTKVVAGFTREEFFAKDNMFWETKHERLISRVNEDYELVNKLSDEVFVDLMRHRPYYVSYYKKPFSEQLQSVLVSRLSYRDLINMWDKFDTKHHIQAVINSPYLCTYSSVNSNFKDENIQVELINTCIENNTWDPFLYLFGHAQVTLKPAAVKLAFEKCRSWLNRVLPAQPRGVERIYQQLIGQGSEQIKLAA